MKKEELSIFFIVLLLAVKACDASSITADQLKEIMPQCVHPEYLVYINSAFVEGQIETCARQSAFLAQVAHESGQLRYMEELASGAEYEGRRDLGNIYPGDGKKYKGRGPLQLTGRANYRAAGLALGLDLETNPDQVATPEVGFRTSVWFWGNRGLNALADQNTLTAFQQITRKINGGTNGEADREMYWATAKTTLGCATTTQPTSKPSSTPSSTPLSSTPPSSTPLSSTPLSSTPPSSTPLSSTPLSSTPLSSTPPSSTPPSSTLPPETTPPVTDPPVTDPPVTDPPVTDPPYPDPPYPDPPYPDPPYPDPPYPDPAPYGGGDGGGGDGDGGGY